MHRKHTFFIKYISLACCLMLTLGGCAAQDHTPIELEATQMQSSAENNGADSADSNATGTQLPDAGNPSTAPTAEPTPAPTATPTMEPTPAPTLPQPGILSLENLLRTALLPVGNTMYVWGGGWNEADTGAGTEALTLGLSEQWANYAATQDSTYNYKNTRYQIHDGLDCSGYMGWVLFNVFQTENATSEEDGYVMSSTKMAETFSDYGWGEYLTTDITQWKPGDICSMSGHVWMSLGMCEDGSVLLLHSSPPGVRICGTRLSDGSDSRAIALAKQIMSTRYPDWYNRYPACDVGYNYLTDSKIMRWNTETLADESGMQEMTAAEISSLLFDL